MIQTDDGVYINIGKNKIIQPLDPLVCIVKLALLVIKPDLTKLSIHNNRISLQEPGTSQGMLRWIQGDTKNDIHSLYYPIRRAYELYSDLSKKSDGLLPHEKGDVEHKDVKFYNEIFGSSLQDELKTLFVQASKGLSKLMVTYEDHPIINRCLISYNSILTGQTTLDSKDEVYVNLVYLFRSLWSRQEIHLIAHLVKSLETTEDVENTVKAIESLLVQIEKRFYESLTQFSKTTHTL